MGLDMNLYSIPHKDTNIPVDQSFNNLDQFEVHDLGYWRKMNHIHGYMEKLYRSKGGINPYFNCATVQLTKEDIKKLLTLIFNRKLKPVEGFFFGGDKRPVETDTYTIRTLCNALDDITNGQDVYYQAWF